MDRINGELGWVNSSNLQTEKKWADISNTSSKSKRGLNIIFNFLVYGFCLILIIGSAMFALNNDTGKSLFGYRFYSVLTVSMRPEFDAGDMIFIKLCEPEDIQAGDVVTFVPSRKSTAYLTHRVTKIISDENGVPQQIITKGDNNNAEDPPVSVKAVVGIYLFHIPGAGNIIQFISENLILMGICIVSSFVLLVFLRSYFATKRKM